MAGTVKVTQPQRAQWPSDHKLGNWIRQKILTTCHMSTNIIISTMTSRRMRRGKKDVESRVRAFTSCHWHPPLNPSCHVLPHPHNPSPHLLLPSVCLWRQGFSKFDFFLLLLLSTTTLHELMLIATWRYLKSLGIQAGNKARKGAGKATITQYIVIYPVAIRQSLRLHLQPFLCVFLSCCSSFLFSFFWQALLECSGLHFSAYVQPPHPF